MQIWKQHIKKIILSININVVAFSKQTDKKNSSNISIKKSQKYSLYSKSLSPPSRMLLDNFWQHKADHW